MYCFCVCLFVFVWLLRLQERCTVYLLALHPYSVADVFWLNSIANTVGTRYTYIRWLKAQGWYIGAVVAANCGTWHNGISSLDASGAVFQSPFSSHLICIRLNIVVCQNATKHCPIEQTYSNAVKEKKIWCYVERVSDKTNDNTRFWVTSTRKSCGQRDD